MRSEAIEDWLNAITYARLVDGQPTVRAIGNRAGVSHTTVAAMFNGQYVPNWRTASTILAALSTDSLQYLPAWRLAMADHRLLLAQGQDVDAPQPSRGSRLMDATPPSVHQELTEIRALLQQVLDLLERRRPEGFRD